MTITWAVGVWQLELIHQTQSGSKVAKSNGILKLLMLCTVGLSVTMTITMILTKSVSD